MMCKRVLYLQKSIPDNVDPPDFLKELTINQGVYFFTMKEAILFSTRISHQFSAAVVFVLIFYFCLTNVLSTSHLLAIDSLLLINAIIIRIFRDSSFSCSEIVSNFRQMLLLAIVLLILSPVLITLTQTISNDTIWCMGIGLLIVHLYTHDYDPEIRDSLQHRYTSPISVNAPIFAAIVFGSRLGSPYQVFGLVLFAVLFFALFPVFRHHIKRSSKTNKDNYRILLLMLCVIAPVLLFVSQLLLLCYFASIFFLSVLLPMLFVYMQRYKHVIHGKWDEATPPPQST